ncbi:transposable element Tc1 transposase [Trichonephila clavipes]|nr:transposable element Tc1 transposase [Trichonephila clavipes]
MEERFAFRFPVTPSIIIDEGERILERIWMVSPRCDVVFGITRLRGKMSAISEGMEPLKDVHRSVTVLGIAKRLRIWRQAHEAMNTVCQVRIVQGRGGSIMVWGAFSWYVLGSLMRVQTSFSAFRYLDFLVVQLHPFMLICYPNANGVFQQDNCISHKSRLDTAIRGFSSGRTQGTTPADDRYIVLQARRNRRQTAGEIARHTTQATGRPISRFTVARRLHGLGLFARRPVRCVPLTLANRRRRSLWCREQRNWRDNEWGRVLFTDESRFSLSSDSHRILIWRERGSRDHPSNIIERDKGAMGLQFLFMDDNAPCHHTVAAEQILESKDIEGMDCPTRSPDLNPKEHVWDFLGRRLAARTLPPVTIWELRLALQDE